MYVRKKGINEGERNGGNKKWKYKKNEKGEGVIKNEDIRGKSWIIKGVYYEQIKFLF
jgi:hypothetical protein